MNRKLRCATLVLGVTLWAILVTFTAVSVNKNHWMPEIPKTWDDTALTDWATPLAGLDLRPTLISARDYYAMRIENLRTYPVYFPGREPKGYWKMLQGMGPRPLIEPDKLNTEADWIAAGRRVFEEVDHLHLRTGDPKLITAARSPETFKNAEPLPDGTVPSLRWVPTQNGVVLSFSNCSNCHVLGLPGGARVPGAPEFGAGSGSQDRSRGPARALRDQVYVGNSVMEGDSPFLTGAGPRGMLRYQESGVPWRKDDINERFKTLTEAEYKELKTAFLRSGGLPRWNGSLYYAAKIPDLIGVKDRKYIDHTATHLHRGIGDLMRYAALVSFADAADFGPYHMLLPDTKRVQARLSDEALYALALYIYSLQPPPNPNSFDDSARAGQGIFAREGCAMCHTPPFYTSNKLTLAEGFALPKDAPATLDILPISVGTDPGLALKTRKGTGYYKVPSLKGVWYRGHYLHDGAVASLKELFDPGRVKESHVPGGWRLPGTQTHAIKGHPFGLNLSADERYQLIAFLRTL